MVPFDLWIQGWILVLWNAVVVLVPCFLIMKIGLKLIHQLGHYPTKAPSLHKGIFLQLFLVEVVSFVLLAASYQLLAWK